MFKPEIKPLPEHLAIHRKIKKKHFFFKFHYPKIALLILSIILAYLLFRIPAVADFASSLNNYSYIGVFIAGLFFSFGFTAPFAVGFFLTMGGLSLFNIVIYSLIGGISGLLADLLIFRFIRISFEDEFKKIERTKFSRHFSRVVDRALGHKIKAYLLYGIIGLVIASPLPDEVGVVLLAGLTKINQKVFGVVSFVLHFIGIFILLGL